MSHRAESLNVEHVEPTIPSQRRSAVRLPNMRPITDAYRKFQNKAGQSASYLARRTQALAADIKRKTARMRDEKPLQIVAAIALTAFLAGVLVRMGRSKS